MSGIAGIIHFDGRPVEPGQIEGMTAAMEYRGPDGIHHWVQGPVALGQCMLRTTPESLEETQPLANEDGGLVLVMDGRIDNREELRRDLLARGVRLRSRSDAELVLRAYEAWSERSVERLEGDFVFAIVAPRDRTVFMARDVVGVKPIYLWKSAGSLRFASDSHALLTLPGSPTSINEKMVLEHLQMTFDDLEETLVADIRRLAPASWMKHSPRHSETRRYWRPGAGRTIYYARHQEYVEHFYEVLNAAVRSRMRSIGDVGYYLSGGLDSSTVLAVGKRLSAAPARLKSYSLVFPGEDCDESFYISSMNAATDAEGCMLPGLPASAEYYSSCIARFQDVCDAPNSAMLNPLRSAARNHGVRSMLTGYGGDEWFGKSPYYYSDMLRTLSLSSLADEIAYSSKTGASNSAVARAVVFQGIAPLLPAKFKHAIRSTRSWLSGGRQGEGYAAVVSDELASRFPSSGAIPSNLWNGNHRTLSYLHATLASGMNIRGLEIENRTTALFGLEERSPFYDRGVIDFAFRIPEDERSRGPGKSLMREAMVGLLPEEVRTRGDKAEFSAVLAKTLLMPQIKAALACPRLVDHRWVDPLRINQAFTAFEAAYRGGDAGYGRYVWPLWMAFCLEQTVGAIMKPKVAQSA